MKYFKALYDLSMLFCQCVECKKISSEELNNFHNRGAICDKCRKKIRARKKDGPMCQEAAEALALHKQKQMAGLAGLEIYHGKVGNA